MKSDKFYVKLQNLIFAWLHLVVTIIGFGIAGYHALGDYLHAISTSEHDSKYLSYLMIYLEGFMCLAMLLITWIAGVFIVGVQKHRICMMAPLIGVYILSLIFSFIASFYQLPYIAAVLFYIYLVCISCRLYRNLKNNPLDHPDGTEGERRASLAIEQEV